MIFLLIGTFDWWINDLCTNMPFKFDICDEILKKKINIFNPRLWNFCTKGHLNGVKTVLWIRSKHANVQRELWIFIDTKDYDKTKFMSKLKIRNFSSDKGWKSANERNKNHKKTTDTPQICHRNATNVFVLTTPKCNSAPL